MSRALRLYACDANISIVRTHFVSTLHQLISYCDVICIGKPSYSRRHLKQLAGVSKHITAEEIPYVYNSCVASSIFDNTTSATSTSRPKKFCDGASGSTASITAATTTTTTHRAVGLLRAGSTLRSQDSGHCEHSWWYLSRRQVVSAVSSQQSAHRFSSQQSACM